MKGRMEKPRKWLVPLVAIAVVVLLSGTALAISGIIFQKEQPLDVVAAGQIRTNLTFDKLAPIMLIGEVTTGGYWINCTNPDPRPMTYELVAVVTPGIGSSGTVSIYLNKAAIQTVPGNQGFINWTIAFQPVGAQGVHYALFTVYQSTA